MSITPGKAEEEAALNWNGSDPSGHVQEEGLGQAHGQVQAGMFICSQGGDY